MSECDCMCHNQLKSPICLTCACSIKSIKDFTERLEAVEKWKNRTDVILHHCYNNIIAILYQRNESTNDEYILSD